jgi:hypothetical protein
MHHLKASDQTFDFEIGLPVTVNVKPQGRMTMSGIRAARTIYRGEYDGLGEACSPSCDGSTRRASRQRPISGGLCPHPAIGKPRSTAPVVLPKCELKL